MYQHGPSERFRFSLPRPRLIGMTAPRRPSDRSSCLISLDCLSTVCLHGAYELGSRRRRGGGVAVGHFLDWLDVSPLAHVANAQLSLSTFCFVRILMHAMHALGNIIVWAYWRPPGARQRYKQDELLKERKKDK